METGTIFMQRATETAASCTQAGRRSALNGIISIRIPARGLRPFAPVPAYRFRCRADGAVVYFYHGIQELRAAAEQRLWEEPEDLTGAIRKYKREETTYDRQEMKARIERSRELIDWSREEYQSDQTLKKPQPPLVKAPMTENSLELPKNFGDLPMDKSFLRILHDRRSNRVFTGGSMDLLTLSFLLWAQQGIRGIRGNNYATLRTVPSAGSRHPFECYPLILNVEGLEPGLYHYLPMEHRLEFF